MIKVFHPMFSAGVSEIYHQYVVERTKGNRRDFYDGKNRHPVPTGGDGLHSGSNPGSVDLGGIEPKHRQPSDPNNELKEKGKGGGPICRACRSEREQD